VLGVQVNAVTMAEAVERIQAWIEAGDRQYVCVCSVHGVMECRRSPELLRIFNAAGMVTPDGMPLVWLARLGGHRRTERVYGPDLLLAALGSLLPQGRRHLFYGGSGGAADRLARLMTERFPGLLVAGAIEPPFAPLDELCSEETAVAINAATPDVVWVGLSTPKQERWMARMRAGLAAPVLIGVGAAFDFHTGRVRQAPRFVRRAGLEWLFRLLVEPRRLWRRYAVVVPWFIFDAFLQKLRLKRFQ
jgi:N-acetylglucosaminyldiphosphoundecaprenol N-acetyl-beta-D-mannosaminyltransferase